MPAISAGSHPNQSMMTARWIVRSSTRSPAASDFIWSPAGTFVTTPCRYLLNCELDIGWLARTVRRYSSRSVIPSSTQAWIIRASSPPANFPCSAMIGGASEPPMHNDVGDYRMRVAAFLARQGTQCRRPAG